MYSAQSVGSITSSKTLDEVVRRALPLPIAWKRTSETGTIGLPQGAGRDSNLQLPCTPHGQSSVVLATDEVVTRAFTVLCY
jgi:hypothetical protein